MCWIRFPSALRSLLLPFLILWFKNQVVLILQGLWEVFSEVKYDELLVCACLFVKAQCPLSDFILLPSFSFAFAALSSPSRESSWSETLSDDFKVSKSECWRKQGQEQCHRVVELCMNLWLKVSARNAFPLCCHCSPEDFLGSVGGKTINFSHKEYFSLISQDSLFKQKHLVSAQITAC